MISLSSNLIGLNGISINFLVLFYNCKYKTKMHVRMFRMGIIKVI